ncbi:MAG: CDP-alcohol phosphatidyltransferase family protein [Clostridiales bacterium]|nr:CDP-alcohol phosphatidyltransferase family protein [Candidatus Coliplasma caballi]
MKSKFVIGYYNFADIVTMLGLVFGVLACFLVGAHPVVAMLFLALAGLCDSMDGRIARANKNRTKREKFYGVQLDSLCDVVSFGVAPAVMAYRLGYDTAFDLILYALFIACGAIRLANFNTEAALDTPDLKMTHFTGFPIPTSVLWFPLPLILHLLTNGSAGWLFRILFVLTAYGYISRIRIPKPAGRQQLVIFAYETVALLILFIIALAQR